MTKNEIIKAVLNCEFVVYKQRNMQYELLATVMIKEGK
jgi:hypothetical protein